MTDEDVIKRRLLIDGDGTGDDRRLNVLLKTFIKWCSTNDSSENNQLMYNRLIAYLAQSEFAVIKSDYAVKMMKQELKNYKSISDTIETSIELAKKDIEASKEDLILAKQIRRNRMEYDVLAKVIHSQPDRKMTTTQLDLLQKELYELEEKKSQLQKKLETRKKDFLVLMRSFKELQMKLDDNAEEIDNQIDESYDENLEKMSVDEIHEK
ncbi:THO complex protein 7 [Condylostylus longicornis]|uniref:THO complex protein 7 n=1 Tax=Condylostylus longicornis TaxID=2530218 RepID=UPI00244E1E95|nr:THO complex protein 7 [Condylostylus longicornis]